MLPLSPADYRKASFSLALLRKVICYTVAFCDRLVISEDFKKVSPYWSIKAPC